MFALALLMLACCINRAAAAEPVPPEGPADVDASAQTAFAAAPLRLRIRELDVAQAEFAIFVMPGERVAIHALAASGPYRIAASAGRIEPRLAYVAPRRDQGWSWTAPRRSGLQRLTVTRSSDGQQVRLNAFVLVPFGEISGGDLHGYRIGHYPDKPLHGNPLYRPPRGFVEVTPQNRNTRLSPHFTLGEFVSKQAGGYPKFLVLDERLLLALEAIIVELRSEGVDVSGLHVMSGFRTPYYNAAIDNVTYSLHQWGVAADIFIDEDRDGIMDDLDGDGRITIADARRLYRVIDALHRKPEYSAYVGGTGLYGPRLPVRGPFVHVDVRGWRAQW